WSCLRTLLDDRHADLAEDEASRDGGARAAFEQVLAAVGTHHDDAVGRLEVGHDPAVVAALQAGVHLREGAGRVGHGEILRAGFVRGGAAPEHHRVGREGQGRAVVELQGVADARAAFDDDRLAEVVVIVVDRRGGGGGRGDGGLLDRRGGGRRGDRRRGG